MYRPGLTTDKGKPAARRGRKVMGPRGWVARLPKGYKSMRSAPSCVVNFLKREDGPTAVEYAVMLALIIVVCIAAITTIGTKANDTLNTAGNALGS
jgi:pilus assembly protein Flp/PilA